MATADKDRPDLEFESEWKELEFMEFGHFKDLVLVCLAENIPLRTVIMARSELEQMRMRTKEKEKRGGVEMEARSTEVSDKKRHAEMYKDVSIREPGELRPSTAIKLPLVYDVFPLRRLDILRCQTYFARLE